MRALFLTWDGPSQTYLESLFFPIFAGLRESGIDVHVLQLTWAPPARLEPVHAAARRSGLTYVSQHVPSSLRRVALPAVIAFGAALASRYGRAHGVQTLFPRSLIPGAMAELALRARQPFDLVFDADGFMADERVDFGRLSESSPVYRALRAIERLSVRRARAVICRTAAARDILVERAGSARGTREKIFVAPNGKDKRLFAPCDAAERSRIRQAHGVGQDAPWLVYAGSIGPQYCPELMLECVARVRARRPDAVFSCFAFQTGALRELARQRGLSDAVRFAELPPGELARTLSAADVGLALRREAPSQRGVSPIKVAEYLLAGVPVVASEVGDLRQQLSGSDAALLVDTRDPGLAELVADWAVRRVAPARQALSARARELGLRWFDLAGCVDSYRRALLHQVSG